MLRPLNLRHLLALAIIVLTTTLIALVTFTIGQGGVRRIEREIGHALMLLADQMQDKLDRALFERYREILRAGRLFATLAIADRPDDIQTWLAALREDSGYAWIGFADRNGRIVRSTERRLVNTDVSQYVWFKSGLNGTTVGDVHKSKMLGTFLRSRGNSTARYLYIATPVVDQSGATIGVLGAYLNWDWANEIRDSLFGTSQAGRTEQVLVLSKFGAVLLGPAELIGKSLNLESVRAALSGANLFAIEHWPDGETYVTGYARSDGYRNFAGLGWVVLVRETTDVALAPVRHFQSLALAWGGILAALGALVAWTLSQRIAAPLLRLATSADAVRRGDDVGIPKLHDYVEAATLSKSLDTLVSELKQRQAALKKLNQSLEEKVSQRTSELAARNAALTVAREEAEKATTAKSRFLAAASHDLRQPLHAMTLFARALSRRVSGDEATRLVQQLESSLASLKDMFDALLNVSRLDVGLMQPSFASISVNELLQRNCEAFHAEAHARGLKFKCRGLDASIVTDPILLETMVRNLVANALKFTRTGGVLLAARRRAGRIAIEVWDTGPGIPRERQERIFDEFERAHEHASGTNEGLGLGLSIVRRYARLLDIEISLASRVGRGTCFSLLLPPRTLDRESISREVEATSTDLSPYLRGLKVVVIDDDAQIVAAMERELADRGCCPRSFTTVEEAETALLADLTTDVAIVDYNLGGNDTGPALLERIESARGRHIPALVLTGGTDLSALTAVIASGRPWLIKPADPDVVAAEVARLARQAASAHAEEVH